MIVASCWFGEGKNHHLLFDYWKVLVRKNLESPSPKEALCQVWLKLAKWFWTRRFFILCIVFSLFRNNLPLKKIVALHLKKQIWIPFTPECFVPSLVEIGTVVLENKKKMWKVYDDNDNNEDDDIEDDGQRTNCDQKRQKILSLRMKYLNAIGAEF